MPTLTTHLRVLSAAPVFLRTGHSQSSITPKLLL
jgi:hypothetical protein